MSLAVQNLPAKDLMTLRNSPLTVRNSNTRLRLPSYTDEMLLAKLKSKTKDSYARQRNLSNQLQRRIEDRHTKNRVASLQKTAQGRDGKRWDLRGDQVLRRDWLRQKKQWECQLAQSASDMTVRIEDEDMEDVIQSRETSNGYPVDDVFSQEEREVQALVSLLEEKECHPPDNTATNIAKHEYDFDDEEYDRLLAEVAAHSEGHGQSLLERHGQDLEMLLD